MATATLKIDIWTEGKALPDGNDLPEAFVPHLEHIQRLCAEGYSSGQIVDEGFMGWWSITRSEGPAS